MLYFEDVEVGSARTSGEFELTEQGVVEFARAWDPQPFHVDPEAARRSPFGGLTASACHIFSVAGKLLSEMEPLAVIAAARHELDLLKPARPGDRLSLTVVRREAPLAIEAGPGHRAARGRAQDARRRSNRPPHVDDRARAPEHGLTKPNLRPVRSYIRRFGHLAGPQPS